MKTASILEFSDNQSQTRYHTRPIDGVEIFYREAGSRSKPTILLLHGFPTSSHMFRNLIPALAENYHVIAPDYPGFGHSAMPDRASFSYTFDKFAQLVEKLIESLGINRYAIYVFDYGAPVGFRPSSRAGITRLSFTTSTSPGSRKRPTSLKRRCWKASSRRETTWP